MLERLADRAAHRTRDRSRRHPPPQPRSRRGHALQDADRADLRLRRFSQGLCARVGDCRLRRLRATPARGRARAGGCAASVSPAMSNRRASRPRALPARSARAPDSSRPRRSGCNRMAAVRAHARHPQSRPGTRHHLRADPALAAGRSARKHRDQSKATPMPCRTAPARSARARSRSAAARSIAPPTRSSPRAS